jgi:dTDP-4-amino-4,6-dideoxygalactose transaminase
LPVAAEVADQVICLPIFSDLPNEVLDELINFFK